MFALAMTALGWFVTYKLNARSQRKALINSLTNEARQDMVDAIREFHDWCVDVNSCVAGMPVDDITSLGRGREHHELRRRTLIEHSLDGRTLKWAKRLEEYEPLFPYTARVREELLQKVTAVCEDLRGIADKHGGGSVPSEAERQTCTGTVMDLLALTWDLLVFIQNDSLGRLTGHRISARVPQDPDAIRLSVDGCGGLAIVRSSRQ